MLEYDISGFLKGETVNDIKRSNEFLGSIKDDISLIKKAVTGINVSTKKTSIASPRQSPQRSIEKLSSIANKLSTVTPNTRQKDSRGRFVSNSAVNPGQKKDERGRFTSNPLNGGENSSASGIKGLGNKIAGAITETSAGLEDVDPTVKAFQEVARPLARSYQFLSGSNDNNGQNRWFRRIFKVLKLTKKDDTVYQKATKKSLKEIEEKSGFSDGEGGDSGFLMSILPKVGLVSLAAVSGIGTAILGGLAATLGVIFSPISLAIGAAAALAWGVFTEDGRKFFGDLGNQIVSVFKDHFPKTAKAISSAHGKAVDFVSNNIIEPVAEALNKGGYKTEPGKRYGRNRKRKPARTSGNKDALIKEMIASGITNPKEQALFLAQMDHESNGFSRLEENLNYKPSRLLQISKTARSKGSGAVSAAVKQGPEAIAELLYGGRKDLGNTEKGDGYRFRGRGFTQLTGRSNYTEASKALGIDLVNNPDAAASPETAAKIATWFHKKNANLVNASRSGDVTTARRLVNGGANGLADVNSKYNSYLAQTGSNAFVGAKTVSASAQLPTLPTLSKSQAISESPSVVTPLNSGTKRQGISVTVAKGDVTQDVKDRGIAHIVTGGLSS